MQPPASTMSMSRRGFLGGARSAPNGASAPAISERCLAARGVYCRSCADACAAAAIRAAPALGGSARILVDAERCTGCGDCLRACPADAIWVEAAENTDEERYSPGERYARTYEINMLRCIFCGYCEDACPTEAIVLTREHRLSFTDRLDAIYTKDMLIEPSAEGQPDTPQQVPPGAFDRSIPDMEDPK